jgi:cobaltochelatase CobS
MVLVNANEATRLINVGEQIPDSQRHTKDSEPPAPLPKPQCNDWTCVTEATWQAPDGQWLCDNHKPLPGDPGKPAAAPADTSKVTADGDLAAAMAVMAKAFGPKIDAEQIRQMVHDEFSAAVFPTRTVILNTDGDDVTPADMPETSHEMLADILTDIMAAASSPTPMSVLMVGPAASGKSTLAEQAATALGSRYGEISLNPMLPVTSLLGYMNANGDYIGTVFRDMWENGGVFHADEFDNGHPSTMATLNAALAKGRGGSIGFPDGMVQRHDDFVFIASANTFGRGPDRVYVGRQQLDAATLNRFIVEEIGYDEALEHTVCLATGLENDKVAEVLRYVRSIRQNLTSKKMTVLMTPRNSVFACTLLKAGKPWAKVHQAAIRQGVSDADWSKATDGVVPPRV